MVPSDMMNLMVMTGTQFDKSYVLSVLRLCRGDKQTIFAPAAPMALDLQDIMIARKPMLPSEMKELVMMTGTRFNNIFARRLLQLRRDLRYAQQAETASAKRKADPQWLHLGPRKCYLLGYQ